MATALPLDPRVRLPIFITTAHVYLDDITDEIGPTVIVPGSHRSGRAPDLAQDASCRNDRRGTVTTESVTPS